MQLSLQAEILYTFQDIKKVTKKIMFLLIILIYINTYKAVLFLFKSGTSTSSVFSFFFFNEGNHNLLQVAFGSGQPF